MKDRTDLHALGLLLLLGMSLRVTLLAVPPLLPAVHQTLDLNEKAVGLLTALPILLLAVAASGGSLLIHRLGARRAVVIGLGLLGLAGAARGIGPTVAMLYLATFVMGCGLAICQPALPSLVGLWMPKRAAAGTATYSAGLLVGELLAAGLTLPLVLGLLAGSWELGLAVWSIPVIGAAVLVAWLSPRQPSRVPAPSSHWWPDWRDSQTWRLGLLLGAGQIAYWVPNAFIADYLKSLGHADYVAGALLSLNAAQLPASFGLILWGHLFVQKRWPFVAIAALISIGILGLIGTAPGLAVWWAALLGFAGASIFVLNLALPPLLAAPQDVHRLSAGIFSISYSCVFVAPLLGGAIWDATGLPATAFLPVLVGALAVVWMSARIDLTRGTVRQTSGVSRPVN